MGACWYCHWGWAKPVAEIYKEAIVKLNGDDFPLLSGPAHVVWEDENFDHAECCLEEFDKKWDECFGEFHDPGDLQKEVARWSLVELTKIPIKQRCVEPEEYTGQDPQLFPPASGIEVVTGREINDFVIKNTRRTK